MLYHVWGGDSRRPTRDLDLLGHGSPETGRVEGIFRRIIATEVPDDGLKFGDPVAEPIREDASYGGIRVKMTARLGNIRIPIQVDVGFGDAVDPSPQEREFPVLLTTLPAPVIRVYPPETVVAEKLEALVVLDLQNSRMKDFFDLHFLLSGDRLDRVLLERSIRGTFERRKTPSPEECSAGLTDEFGELKQPMWKAFLNRNGLKEIPEDFIEVVGFIRKALPFGWTCRLRKFTRNSRVCIFSPKYPSENRHKSRFGCRSETFRGVSLMKSKSGTFYFWLRCIG